MRLLFTAYLILAGGSLFAGDFTFERQEDRVVVLLGDDLFTEYRFADRRPCLFPVIGPAGQNLVRRWPLDSNPDHVESRDHPHHTGIWYAHGDVRISGQDQASDFWHKDLIEHQRFVDFEPNARNDKLVTENLWNHREGSAVCSDRTTITFGQGNEIRWIDWQTEIQAPEQQEVILGDTKEGTMAIRVREELTLAAQNKEFRHLSQGHIATSEGITNGDAWGKRARWCVSHGPLEGKPVVVALFDHPANPRHPTWFVARPYGLFSANPFGQHDFEQAPEGSGDFSIPAGTSVTFRYRFLFLNSVFDAEELETHYLKYSQSKE